MKIEEFIEKNPCLECICKPICKQKTWTQIFIDCNRIFIYYESEKEDWSVLKLDSK